MKITRSFRLILVTLFCLNTNGCIYGKLQKFQKQDYFKIIEYKDISGSVFMVDSYINKTEKSTVYITTKGDSIFLNTGLLSPPIFITDLDELLNFIDRNLEYPTICNDCEGRVTLILLIDQSGVLKDIRVISGIEGCPQYEEAAVAFVKKYMTQWHPAISDKNQNITSIYRLPIYFK